MSLKKKARFLCAAAVLFSLAFTQSGVHGQVTDEGYAANTPWSGYWWPIKTGELLVPLGKYDQVTGNHAAAWERSTNPPGTNVPDWWGYCQGWAASSVMEKEPTSAVTYGNQTFSVGDQKGLLAASHADDVANSFGARFNGDSGDDINDIAPDMLWNELRRHLREQRIPLVFDLSPGAEVWNYPAYAYRVTYSPVEGEVCPCKMEVWLANDNVPKEYVGLQRIYKVYTFEAKFQNGTTVLGTGRWTGNSKQDHPDFVWSPYVVHSENSELNYKLVCDILGTTPANGGNGGTTVDENNHADDTAPANGGNEETTVAENGHADDAAPTDGESGEAEIVETARPEEAVVSTETETAIVAPAVTAEDLTALTEGKPSNWDFDITVDKFDGGEYAQGEGIAVSGKSEKAGYLYLIAIDPDQKISLIYPTGNADNRIEAGEVFTVPAPDSGEKFYLTGPAGDYRIHAVICESPLGAEPNAADLTGKKNSDSDAIQGK